MLPTLSAHSRLLVVAPHPDDETIATGALIQQVLAVGGAVRVLLLTDGDNNPWPQRWMERRVVIRAADRARWGRLRRAELLKALAHLGLSADALVAMGWPDQGLTTRLIRQRDASVAALHAVIDDFSPNVLAMPALDDRHPDHGAAHVLMRLALADIAPSPRCLLYRVHGGALQDDAEVGWSMSPRMRQRKRDALHAHASQLVLSGRRMHRLAGGEERFRCLAQQRVDVPRASLPWHPAWFSRPWLRLVVVGRSGADVWRWGWVPWRRDECAEHLLRCDRLSPGQPCFVKLELALPSPWIFDRWGWRELGR